jgi:hypothetical protein
MQARGQYKELKGFLTELKTKHGAVGIKLSTEESGHSLKFIDFINNRVSNGILPLNMKIGGPNAKTDIINGLDSGVSGFIGPMIESSFGVKQYVLALRDIAGIDRMNELLISINIESINAYKNIDNIINSPEIIDIDQIVIGSSDLAASISKPKNDPDLLKMVKEITRKAKKIGKLVRIGGIMGLCVKTPDILESLLNDTGADKINSANVCFEVIKLDDIRNTYFKALEYEFKMNLFWLIQKKKRLTLLEKRALSSEKRFNQLQY